MKICQVERVFPLLAHTDLLGAEAMGFAGQAIGPRSADEGKPRWFAIEAEKRELRVSTEFTHEEIAQMIGSSRETVTLLLGDTKRKDLIRLEGATLVIPNRIALQAIAA